MKSSRDLEALATELLNRKGLEFLSCKVARSLWAGYGYICRIRATTSVHDGSESCKAGPEAQYFILKFIQPPTRPEYLISLAADEGHIRKVLSYQVEQSFYNRLAPQMPESIPLAACISSINSTSVENHTTAMIMTDLREAFPIAGEATIELNNTQTYAALDWLANFHGFWWTKSSDLRQSTLVLPPLAHIADGGSLILSEDCIWLNGGYTYLATRQVEYSGLRTNQDSEWSSRLCDSTKGGKSSVAELAAAFLAPGIESTGSNRCGLPSPVDASSQPYQTLIHGDVKSENLFTTVKGDSAVFYDFQYVGLGLGVCDLAKFFTCCVPLNLLLDDVDDIYRLTEMAMQKGEEMLLKHYLSQLCVISGKNYRWDIFIRHWETALVDWLRFQASWGFWGNSEWLEARSRSILEDTAWMDWLRSTRHK